MDYAKISTGYFMKGYNCAQSVLVTFAPQLGLEEEYCFKLAAGFGAGLGYRGEMCGAVTGAYMVLGLKYGFTEPGDSSKREKTQEKITEFIRRFKEKHGSVSCKELINADVSDPKQLIRAREMNIFRNENLCPKFIADAAEILKVLLRG